jgi:hypothetical protein
MKKLVFKISVVDPDWAKMLNPYPDPNRSQSGSTTHTDTEHFISLDLLFW